MSITDDSSEFPGLISIALHDQKIDTVSKERILNDSKSSKRQLELEHLDPVS